MAKSATLASLLKDLSSANFGLVIAYLLPGLVALWGASYFSPTLQAWLGTRPSDAPTVAGFLYVTPAAIGAGITVSTIRWMLLDTIHHWTGIRRPDFDYARLECNIQAFDLLVRHHYDYYKASANGLVAVAFTYLAHRTATGFSTTPLTATDALILLLGVVLFVGSRNNLKNYYGRVEMSLGSRAHQPRQSQNDADSEKNGTQDRDQELTKPPDSLH